MDIHISDVRIYEHSLVLFILNRSLSVMSSEPALAVELKTEFMLT